MTVPGLLPFAVLSQTKDPTMVLTQVAQAVEAITNQQQQKNIAAASSILAGLVLKKDFRGNRERATGNRKNSCLKTSFF